ncbi:MAG: DUF3833 domain-containing protein [Halothiobacillus sp.]
MKRTLLLTLIIFSLTGCAGLNLNQFQGTQPQFNLEEYFAGNTYAYGMFQSRGGEIKRIFKVHITGKKVGDEFVLNEQFKYNDGETGERVWHITRDGKDRYIGKAGDIVGVAHGHEVGQALNWHYTLKLPYNGSTIDVKFDDWMVRASPNVMMNRAYVSKFGIRVGEVTLFFTKTDPDL